MAIKAKELRIVLDEKHADETLAMAITRLRKAEKIGSYKMRDVPERSISRKAIKSYLKASGLRCGDGTIEALEKVLARTLDIAVKQCKLDSRKTTRASDVFGQ
jgi:histone H3/H4